MSIPSREGQYFFRDSMVVAGWDGSLKIEENIEISGVVPERRDGWLLSRPTGMGVQR